MHLQRVQFGSIQVNIVAIADIDLPTSRSLQTKQRLRISEQLRWDFTAYMESTDWLDYIYIYMICIHVRYTSVLYAYIVYLRKPLYWRGMWRYRRDWNEMSLSPPLDRLHLVRTITTILAPPSVSMFPPVDLGWDTSDHEPPNRFLTVPVTLHLSLFPHSATLREWKVKGDGRTGRNLPCTGGCRSPASVSPVFALDSLSDLYI